MMIILICSFYEYFLGHFYRKRITNTFNGDMIHTFVGAGFYSTMQTFERSVFYNDLVALFQLLRKCALHKISFVFDRPQGRDLYVSYGCIAAVVTHVIQNTLRFKNSVAFFFA